MITVLHAVAGLAALFFIMLGLKSRLEYDFCAICIASTATWVGISVLYVLDLFDSLTLIVLMAGMTLHGLYQLWEESSSRKYLVFRLPVLLTGIAVFYQIFTWRVIIELQGFLVLAWTFFLILYLYRENSRFEDYVDAVIECCRDW